MTKYYLGDRSREKLVSTIRKVDARTHDFVPQRRRRGKIGSRVSGGNTRKARVTTTITAATSADSTGWGDGYATLCDETTGLPTGDPIAINNEWPIEFGVDYQVEVKKKYAPPRVLGGTCEALDAETYWGDGS